MKILQPLVLKSLRGDIVQEEGATCTVLDQRFVDSNTAIDANLLNTRSRNSHAKTPIPGKPTKSDLIGV
jgi:hypothetical protein